jgi:hypothetical protein
MGSILLFLLILVVVGVFAGVITHDDTVFYVIATALALASILPDIILGTISWLIPDQNEIGVPENEQHYRDSQHCEPGPMGITQRNRKYIK